jgi:hypothetical protein
VLVVTLAEEMPVQEALELAEELERRVGRLPDALAVNALYPPFHAAARGPAEARALWRARRAVNDAELRRLRSEWRGPVLELPMLPAEAGPPLVHALAERLGSLVPGERA